MANLAPEDLESSNDELFLISVLQHGIAKVVDNGVIWYDVLITKLGDKYIDMGENNAAARYEIDVSGGRRRKLVDNAPMGSTLPVEFTVTAPVANVAAANAQDCPDVATTAGQESAKDLSKGMWTNFETEVQSKDVIDEG